MKKIALTAALLLLFPQVVSAADQDAENAAKARNDLYCNTLSKLITSQRNNAEDQLASAATQASLLNMENATLRDRVNALEKQLAELQAAADKKTAAPAPSPDSKN